MRSIRVTFQRSNAPILQKTAKRNIVRYPAKLSSIIFLILFHQRKTNIPTKDEFFATKRFFSVYWFIATACVREYNFFSCKDFSVHLFAGFHFMNTNVYLAMLIFCSCRSRRYRKRATVFVPSRFTQTPQKKCKSIVLLKESFYNTKHLKFNTFSLLLKCLNNLSTTVSGGVQKHSSSCVLVLEVVLRIQKHSEFKYFYTHPQVIE